MEREEVIRVCVEERVPIYQGKIDKTLFAAQLQAIGAHGAAALAADQDAFARAREPGGRLRRAALRVRGPSRPSCPSRRRRSACSASIRSTTGASADRLGRRRSPCPRASPRASRAAGRGTRSRSSSGSNSPTSPAITCSASSSSASFTSVSRRPPRSPRSTRRPRRRTASRARARRPSARMRQRFSLPPRTNFPIAAMPGLLHRLEQQDVRPPLRVRARRARGSRCGRRRRDRPRPSCTKRMISIECERCCAIASRSASSTITNCPFENSQPLTSSSASTSRSCTGHQRFCLIGVPHSACRVRKATSLRCVAGASPIGMLTRPKLMEPFQIVRMGRLESLEGPAGFALAAGALLPCIRWVEMATEATPALPPRPARGRRAHDRRALAARVHERAARTPRTTSRSRGGWEPVSWEEAWQRVDELAHGFLALGHRPGRRGRHPREHEPRVGARSTSRSRSIGASPSCRSTRRAPPATARTSSSTPRPSAVVVEAEDAAREGRGAARRPARAPSTC